jgi:DNA-binding NarL/FixJ family response regulator
VTAELSAASERAERPRPAIAMGPVARRPVGVFVSAADEITRAGIHAALAGDGSLRHVALPADAEVALLVLDVIDDRGAEALRSLHAESGRVVVVASVLDDAAVVLAASAGACAIMRRDEASPGHLATVLRQAAEGHGALPGDLLGSLLSQVGEIQRSVLAPRGLRFSGFAEREIEVLRLIAEGFDTSEIARHLSYSERTVKNVIHDVTARFNLRNRTHAVAYAIRAGVI